MPVKNIPTLFEWSGGQQSWERLTQRFYEKVLEDELLGPVFRHMSPEHSRKVAHFIGEVFGGPPLYSEGKDGSHAHMVQQHLGRMLTEKMRQRWMMLLLETADENQLADDPEFRSALLGYLEWGSRIAVMNSNTNDNPVDPKAPMPRWGWGETGGPYNPDAG